MNMSFKDDHQRGLEYQDFIARELLKHGIILIGLSSYVAQATTGENLLGLEIKLDRQYAHTGNLFIETEYLNSAGDWTPSGTFYADKSWLFGIGDYSTFYIFSKKFLQRLALSDLNKRGLWRKERKSARGYLMPKDYAQKFAEKIFTFDAARASTAVSRLNAAIGVTTASEPQKMKSTPGST